MVLDYDMLVVDGQRVRVLPTMCNSSVKLTCWICRTFASSAPTSAAGLVQQEFGVSSEVADLLTSLFLVGYVAGPIFWGPGSEVFGRRPVFVRTTLPPIVLYSTDDGILQRFLR